MFHKTQNLTKMRTFKFIFVFAMLCCMTQGAFAQKEETILGSRGLRLSGIWGGPKSQITKFGNSNSVVSGGVFGLEFGNALYLGYGSYSLTNDVQWDNVPNQDFNFQWGGPVIAYSVNSWKRVHPVVSVQAGNGNVWFQENAKDKVFIVQPGLGVELNVFRWLHIGLDGGYRFASDADVANVTDAQLSGAFGQLSLRFGYSWSKVGTGFRKKKAEDDAKKM
jgi:hypothetical protein